MTTLTLYNTLDRKPEVFRPIDTENIIMYVCGPTVYDEPHLGHARAAVVFDVLFRLLRRSYGEQYVIYIRNYTDVDDKIIARANERGVPIEEINARYIGAYEEAVDALHCWRPTLAPRVTEVMDDIIAFVQRLIDEGAAYESDGCVFFAVKSFADYGKLSNRSADEIATIHRVEADPRKRDPLDFALWKAVKPDEPSWESPWGPGRPGWHIECSVMATKFGRDTLDIHGGGLDLIFPHHENEIAQCEAATHEPFARYWVHNGFVQINAEKMSKSLGNFKTVNEMLTLWPADTLRYFLLSAHYRTPLDFSVQGLAEATKALQRLYAGCAMIANAEVDQDVEASDKQARKLDALADQVADAVNAFEAALLDDLNTAKALGVVFEVIRDLNRVLAPFAGQYPVAAEPLLEQSRLLLGQVEGLMGFASSAQCATFEQDWNQKAGHLLGLDRGHVEKTIQARLEARHAKNWADADALRDELVATGIILEDSTGHTKWYIDPDFVVEALLQD